MCRFVSRIHAVALLALLLAAGPLISDGHPAAAAPAQASVPAFGHIFVIVLENQEYEDVIGNDDMPYFNQLAREYALLTESYGITHPSLPNYIALTSGDTHGIDTDCNDCFVDAPNLVDQFEDAGKSWKAYLEGMPEPCTLGDVGDYAQRHNPFIYYDDVRTDPARCDNLVPFTEFSDDLAADDLPEFVWITPDMCNDAHDCPVADADDWLATWVPQILDSPAWQDDGLLIVTFDEGTTDAGCCRGSNGGHIATLLISPLAYPGALSDTPVDQYGMLRLIEDAWEMPHLGAAGDAEAPADVFPENATARG
jgi:hypothetical protein